MSRGPQRSDVCVVGSGPAGITVCHELLAAGAQVALVESGWTEADPRACELLDAPAVGPVIKDHPAYLSSSRRSQTCGSAAGWGRGGRAWLTPLTPIDFEQRPWIDGSGWPFGAADLAPYVARAACAFGIDRLQASVVAAPPHDGGGATELVSHRYHFPPNHAVLHERFARLGHSPGFHVQLGATATDLVVRDGRVERIRVLSEGGATWIAAGAFVLAAGAVENARILLCNQEDPDNAIATNRALLGRCFMEHFHVLAGTTRLPRAREWADYLEIAHEPRLGYQTLRVLGLTDAAQRRARLLNASVQLAITDEQAAASSIAANGAVECDLFVRAEQVPNRESRVVLGEDRDRLGRRKPILRWGTTTSDWESLVVAAGIVETELRERHGAQTQLAIRREAPWPWAPAGPAESPRPTWGNHHMGTTRMQSDPELGVVDDDCRVHGTTNLYVAGSSTFPTSGFANPTFTIVALALRLADHLAASAGPVAVSRGPPRARRRGR